MIVTLCGGVGAARMLGGLVQVVDPSQVVAVVNTADDLELHGLYISPDIDTVVYTLAGEINPETGWGLRGETWQAMSALDRYGGESWFRLGDRDLATHLYRTQRLVEGATLSEVTSEIAGAWHVDVTVVPVTDDRIRTIVTIAGDGEIGFQDYFVARQHAVPVTAIRFDGAESTTPAAGVVEQLTDAEVVVIAPSNPIVSIGPLLAVPGIRQALADRTAPTVAVSPIIAGAALKGPADRLLSDLGHEASVVGIARLYAGLADTLVVDEADRGLAGAVEAEGLRCVVAPTIMSGPPEAAALAEVVVGVGR